MGFRKYACELVKQYEKEIYGEVGGYEKYLKFNATKKGNLPEGFEEAPLNKLAGRKQAFEAWVAYGEHNDDPNKIKELEKNTFMKYPEDFKDSIYFTVMSEH